ncbi:MAG: response regulator transcription factor [Phycisphaerales bacterium]
MASAFEQSSSPSRTAAAARPALWPRAGKVDQDDRAPRAAARRSKPEPTNPAPIRTLPHDEAGWMIGNVIRGMALASDPTVQVVSILGAVLDRIGSIGGFMTLFEAGVPEGLRILRVIEVGRWEPRQRAAREAYVQSDHHAADPFLDAYVRAGRVPGPGSAIRHELVDDAAWYASAHVKTFRRRAGMDSAIYVTMPVLDTMNADAMAQHQGAGPRAAAEASTPVRGLSVCANRPWRAAAFTDLDCGLLLATFHGLRPLLKDVWSPPQSRPQNALAEVPFRLRKVLACLMEGDSEKVVAAKLGLRPHTVHTYVKTLYRHFGVHSRAELLVAVTRNSGGSART